VEEGCSRYESRVSWDPPYWVAEALWDILQGENPEEVAWCGTIILLDKEGKELNRG